MNSLTTIDLPQNIHDLEIDFYAARSAVLDSFSDVEASLAILWRSTGDVKFTANQSLGQKLEAFKKIALSSSYSKEAQKVALNQLDKLALLLEVRADIVHSKIHILQCYPETYAKFCNSNAANERFPKIRLLSLCDLREISLVTAYIAKRLAALVKTNPPSPPQPLPGATGDL